MSKEPLKPSSGKGFAGLESLVSDVTDDVKAANTRASAGGGTTDPPPKLEQPPGPTSGTGPATSPQSSKVWIAIVGALCLVVAVAILIDKSNSPSSALQSPPPSTSSTGSRTSPNPRPIPAPTPQPTPPPVRSEYERPPVGQNLVLSVEQIRYCSKEKIRLDAIDSVVNARSQSEIDRFNTLVDDYNSRCGKFRYRGSDLDRAKREVEALRSSISSAAISEWRR